MSTPAPCDGKPQPGMDEKSLGFRACPGCGDNHCPAYASSRSREYRFPLAIADHPPDLYWSENGLGIDGVLDAADVVRRNHGEKLAAILAASEAPAG